MDPQLSILGDHRAIISLVEMLAGQRMEHPM
jgi:hypothetical protein